MEAWWDGSPWGVRSASSVFSLNSCGRAGFQRVLPPILFGIGRQRWGPTREKWRGVSRSLSSCPPSFMGETFGCLCCMALEGGEGHLTDDEM